MSAQQLMPPHLADAATGDTDHAAGDGDRHNPERRGIAAMRLSRTDWTMIVTIVTVGLLMAYLACRGWLPDPAVITAAVKMADPLCQNWVTR
jgi:hypothetical protein